jgi:hypothetical protein
VGVQDSGKRDPSWSGWRRSTTACWNAIA